MFNVSLLFIATSAVPQPAVYNYERVTQRQPRAREDRTEPARAEQPLSAGFPRAYITSWLLIG